MGHNGMRCSLQSREIIADSIETVTCAHVYDACIAMGIVRHNRPSIIVYGGTQRKAHSTIMDKPIDMNTPSEARGAYALGLLQEWSKDGNHTAEGPGMPEQLRASGTLIGAGYKKVALITDGRYFGASHSLIVGHIVPQAAVGGPSALVRDDDLITINARAGQIAMPHVTDAEMRERLKNWKPQKLRVKEGHSQSMPLSWEMLRRVQS